MILNRGFSNIGLLGIPIFQLSSLITVFALISFFPKTFYYFPQELVKTAIPFIVYSFIIFIISIYSGHSLVRIVQDYELVYNIGYLLIGYFVASSLSYDTIIKMLSNVFLLCFFSSLLILFIPEQLQSISPEVGIFQKRYLFGNNVGYYIVLMIAAFFYLYLNQFKKLGFILFPLFLASSLAEQRRFSIILFVLFFINYLFSRNSFKKTIFRLSNYIIPLLLLFFFINYFNIEGERGDFSFDFFSKLYLSILGSSDNELSGAIFWRFNVISDVILLNDTLFKTMFGIGFGTPLSNHVDPITSLATRQSHILFLDTYVRLGIIGLILSINFYYKFFIYLLKNKKYSNFNNWIFITFCGVFLAAQTNPILQIIEVAYPMYFLFGLGIYIIEKRSYALK